MKNSRVRSPFRRLTDPRTKASKIHSSKENTDLNPSSITVEIDGRLLNSDEYNVDASGHITLKHPPRKKSQIIIKGSTHGY